MLNKISSLFVTTLFDFFFKTLEERKPILPFWKSSSVVVAIQLWYAVTCVVKLFIFYTEMWLLRTWQRNFWVQKNSLSTFQNVNIFNFKIGKKKGKAYPLRLAYCLAFYILNDICINYRTGTYKVEVRYPHLFDLQNHKVKYLET